MGSVCVRVLEVAMTDADRRARGAAREGGYERRGSVKRSVKGTEGKGDGEKLRTDARAEETDRQTTTEETRTHAHYHRPLQTSPPTTACTRRLASTLEESTDRGELPALRTIPAPELHLEQHLQQERLNQQLLACQFYSRWGQLMNRRQTSIHSRGRSSQSKCNPMILHQRRYSKRPWGSFFRNFRT